MRATLLAIALLIAGLQHDLVAQSTEGLIGTWKLVSASTRSADGTTNHAPYGSNPTGFLTYAPGGRTPLSVADRITSPYSRRQTMCSTVSHRHSN